MIKNGAISNLVLTDFAKEERVCPECLSAFMPNDQLIVIEKTVFANKIIPLQKPYVIHFTCLEDFTSRLQTSAIKSKDIHKVEQPAEDSTPEIETAPITSTASNIPGSDVEELDFPG